MHKPEVRNILKSERGAFSLLMLIPIAALFAVMFLGMASLLNHVYNDAKRVNTNVSATVLRSNLFAYFKNDQAWTYMKDNNPDLLCVKDNASCLNQNGSIKRIYAPNNTLIYDEDDPQNGFGLNGAPCNGVAAGSNCPFRIQARWEPVCSDTNCDVYDVKINVRLLLENSGFPFSVDKHELELIR